MGGNYEKSIYNQLMEVMERLVSVEKELKNEKKEYKNEVIKLNEKISSLENIIDEKDRQIKILSDDNERLKRIINNNSTNSSMPPSTDQKCQSANQYSSRRKSVKKPGGQKGHTGTTLTKKDIEEKLGTGKYSHKTTIIGKGYGNYAVKYILDFEVVPVINEIRIYEDENGKINIPAEHRSNVIYGSFLKSVVVDLYAEGAMSNERICQFINALTGNTLDISSGSIYSFCKSFSVKAEENLKQIGNELLNEETICTDATVVTVDGKQCYIRNFSSNKAVLYTAMEKKSINALDKIFFLKSYAGTLEHDHETALYHYGKGHGECNVHLLRYLKKNTEEAGTEWASGMSAFLCGINDRRKKHISEGTFFTDEEISKYEKRYDEILADGRKQNKTVKGKIAKQEEKALLVRLEKYKENHLLFMHNFSVPFENNMSERDLRKCKNRQKISGGFRKYSGNEMYCKIISVVETYKRKGMRILENIQKVFEGTPAF